MVHRVDDSFFNRRIGKVPKARGLGPIRMLDHRFDQIAALNKVQRIAQHAVQRAFEYLFVKAVAPGPLWKPHHINLRAREETIGCLIEKQQAHILDPGRFGGPAHHVHLAAQCLHRKRVRVVGQRAAHLAQISFHQRLG